MKGYTRSLEYGSYKLGRRMRGKHGGLRHTALPLEARCRFSRPAINPKPESRKGLLGFMHSYAWSENRKLHLMINSLI